MRLTLDALTRQVTSRASRRSTLTAAVAGALGAMRGVAETEAKRCTKPCGP
jgi:hypothetical protein